jgi:hypothetical protein
LAWKDISLAVFLANKSKYIMDFLEYLLGYSMAESIGLGFIADL